MAKKSYIFLHDKKKNKFLNLYVSFGTIGKAAEKAGIARQTHYDWLNSDDSYKVAFEKAREMTGDILEDEAMRRAMGYEEPVFYKGKKVGTRIVYSDFLMKFLLQGAKPDKYKERVQQETVDVGADGIGWEDSVNAGTETNNQDTVPAGEALAGEDTSESGKSPVLGNSSSPKIRKNRGRGKSHNKDGGKK